MEIIKTLWMLDVLYDDGTWSRLVPLYAVDEQEAWIEAQRWAFRNETPLSKNLRLIHFPCGFTIHTCMLAGYIEQEKSKE